MDVLHVVRTVRTEVHLALYTVPVYFVAKTNAMGGRWDSSNYTVIFPE